MKVAMIARSTLFTNPGGDTVQISGTAAALQKQGVETEIKLCTEEIDYARYDLLHFFNIIRPADILKHITQSGKPYVVSPIFVDYSEYENKVRTGWIGAVSKIFSNNQKEYLKVVARRILNGEKIVSPGYLLTGHRNAVAYILDHAALLLPNSKNEYNRLVTAFETKKEFRIVLHAIDPEIFTAVPVEKDTNLVLCVARIEGLKNQLNLIRALNGSNFHLLIIGAASVNHKDYYEQCRSEAHANVEFMGRMEQKELAQLYAKAKVHILPSWFETGGLSSLEAAAMGCNIVITDKGDTRETFGDGAFYCNPDDISSIKAAVEKASTAPVNTVLQERILNQHTWAIAAEQTRLGYEMALNKASKQEVVQ